MSAAAAARALMGIGDVLTALRPEFPDITISKIRFLESEGLLQPQRTSSGYRKFSSADVDRLRYVLTCQRDHYLPLKVIRDNLAAIDRGLEPPATGAGGTPRVPRGLADEESLPSPEAFRPAHNDLRLSRAELLAESGLSEKVLEQLESFGIVSPLRHGGSTKHYGAAALDVAGAVALATAARLVERDREGWRRTGVEWVHDAAHYDAVVALRRREAAIMREYIRGGRCLMQLLQEALDDPSAAPCGRCSVCTGALPDGLAAEPDIDVTRAVAGVLRAQTHLVEPRKMWPGGVFGSRGRIPASEQPEIGRALIFADAPEWRELVARVFGGQDAAPPDELVDAVVTLLASWRHDWPARPEVVTALAAAGFRQLTAGLAQRIATVGRLSTAELSVSDAVARQGRRRGAAGPPSGARSEQSGTVTGTAAPDLTSAAEAAFWARAVGVPDPAAVAGRVVLLVVDATSSLWPVTIAASKLRSEGATAVLPLVIHRRP